MKDSFDYIYNHHPQPPPPSHPPTDRRTVCRGKIVVGRQDRTMGKRKEIVRVMGDIWDSNDHVFTLRNRCPKFFSFAFVARSRSRGCPRCVGCDVGRCRDRGDIRAEGAGDRKCRNQGDRVNNRIQSIFHSLTLYEMNTWRGEWSP